MQACGYYSSNKWEQALVFTQPPVVTISANPGTIVGAGQTVIFTASVTNATPTAEVRWVKNGMTVVGTTGLTWTTNTLRNGDVISAELVSGGQCATPFPVVSINVLTMGISSGVTTVVSSGSIGSISIYPNPTSGIFTVSVKGTSAGYGKVVSLDIVNALGQHVYTHQLKPDAKDWSLDIRLSEAIANGVYMLKVRAIDAPDYESATLRFELRR